MKHRESRRRKMEAKGMLPFETHSLAKVPMNVPYMKTLLEKRWKLRVASRKRNESDKDFENTIKNLYIVNGWMKTKKNGVKIADPWKMFRDFEDEYKDKKPEYKSESMKRPPTVRRDLKRLLNKE